MKQLTTLFILLFNFYTFSQDVYLKQNRIDLRINEIATSEINVYGFGALHGSSKTKEVEIILLNQLSKNRDRIYYFPETDFSTAFFFEKFLNSGDKKLLEELVYEYGSRVPQEKSIDYFNKWLNLFELNKSKKIKVLGIDEISSYKYCTKLILELIDNQTDWNYIDSLKKIINNSETNWSAYSNSNTKKLLKNVVISYEMNKINLKTKISDTILFNHIIKDIKSTFEPFERESIIYKNYLILGSLYDLKNTFQFFRFGVFHIMKSDINNQESFFSKLILNKIYSAKEVITIQGFLTKSKVLWDLKFDEKNHYKSYSIKKGYGIGDYWLEYYKGIKDLKRNKLSDITLYKLNSLNSPYFERNGYDLIKVKKLFRRSFWYPLKDKSTIDYIDYSILISDSKENIPIEEIK